MSTADAPARTVLALKEWGAVAHALLDGRQTLLLRKGGIHEKAFTVEGDGTGVALFPTVAHSHAERVRPEHADLLPLGAADVSASDLVVRCGVTIVDTIEVRQPARLPEIADLHIWTDASIREERVDFRPKHLLQALVVRAISLPAPVRLQRSDAYGGCRSWLELPLGWDGRSGTVVHGDDRLLADAARVRRAVG
jgi:hypothetical protein